MEENQSQGVSEILSEVGGLLAELERYQRLLTIMFTDIVGSTSYFERHGDLMGMVLLQRVEGILRPLVVKNDGVVVKTIGDAIMAYFENPIQAVRCGVAMQRALTTENRSVSEKEPVHIRVAINLGMAILRGNDVFGDVVNVCSRIEHQAKASTVCISPSVVEAIRAESDLVCQRIGSVAMRGKAKKMDLYEVDWEGVKTAVPGSVTEPSAEQLAMAVGAEGRSPQELRTVIAQAVSPGAVPATMLAVPSKQFFLTEVLPGGKEGREHAVGENCIVMGARGPGIVIKDVFAAPQHAAFTVIGGALYVDDVSGGRGVFLRVRKPRRLEQGEMIAVGRQRFRFAVSEKPADERRAVGELVAVREGVDGKTFLIRKGETSIGRKDCTMTFHDDRYLSRKHARVQFYGTQCVLEDLKSSNGTYVGIQERQVLDEGDSVLVGEKVFRVSVRE